MSTLLPVLSITFPIFALIAIGYGTTAAGMFSAADNRVLGRFTINVALPALIFGALTSRPLAEVLRVDFALSYALAAVVTMGIVGAGLRMAGTPPAQRGIAMMGVACCNSGYVGYPVMLMAFPPLADSLLASSMLVENLFILPLCFVILDLTRPGDGVGTGPGRVPRILGRTFLGLLRRPLILALLCGLAVSLSGVPVPEPAARLLRLLSGAVSAIALFVIGGSLAGVALRGRRAVAAVIVAGKLLLMPLLMAAALAVLPRLGIVAPVDPALRWPYVIAVAVPMIGIYTILALEVGEEAMASIALFAATVLSFFTLSVLLMLAH